MKTIYFATSNSRKFAEIAELFKNAKIGLELKQYKVELLEIQHNDMAQIALASARHIYKALQKPVFVEDAGLFVKVLNGFPGAYSKYVFFTIGPQGILKLLKRNTQREAEFCSYIAYKDSQEEKVFKGICRGSIAQQSQGSQGFGFDPIFIPQGYNNTFAQDIKLKQRVSHRARSTAQLITWLKDKNG